MTSLHQDPYFTFRFADDRIISRFHLDGAPVGQKISVFGFDQLNNARLGLITTAMVGEGGWVELPAPIIVHAGEAFIAVPE